MTIPSTHNQPEYTVSEISGEIRKVVENTFGYVRIRGEISQPKLYSSGHLYLTLKDEGAALSAVCWKGNVSKLKIKPEEGLEVIATGKMSAFPGQSKYQLIIETIEVAGVGALMAMLEKRKQMLMAAGHFDQSRKKALPFMPMRIGIVTSPTGAVIRDMLHRISERSPSHVIVWPVRVQGQGAEHEIAAAIRGFNMLEDHLRPELIIVARGGGSLEDLWCFNEEAVVYAVVESVIAVISAVGHETDWTLIDHASDHRAPTPTAAAERAVPVIAEWIYTVQQLKGRMGVAAARMLAQKATELSAKVRGLPNLTDILSNHIQRLDDRTARLNKALPTLVLEYEKRLAGLQLKPKILLHDIEKHFETSEVWGTRLNNALPNLVVKYEKQLAGLKLRPVLLLRDIEKNFEKLRGWVERLVKAQNVLVDKRLQRLDGLVKLFNSYNYKNVLKRGFTLVKDQNGKLIKSKFDVKGSFKIEFADGEIGVVDE